MSAQVVQVIRSNGKFPAHAIQNGHLSKNFNHILGVPPWHTFTGNPDNEYTLRRRHRYRL